jgi:hypothetical protein
VTWTGSPVTGTGTLGGSWATQSSYQVLACDSGGGVAFRALLPGNLEMNTKGDLVTTDGTSLQRLAGGSATQALFADSSLALGMSWRAIALGDLPLTGALPNTYGDATHVAQITLNSRGYVIAATSVPIAFPSDARFKEALEPLTGALAVVRSLRGVRFRWNEAARAAGVTEENPDIGLVAQEVAPHAPEAVREWDRGFLRVSPERMIALLVEAVKELAARLDRLEQRVRG